MCRVKRKLHFHQSVLFGLVQCNIKLFVFRLSNVVDGTKLTDWHRFLVALPLGY